ncbi:hypothetical protein N7494_001416 [Penicillium frequentans]|uniref:Uncharacterized protein n=1 Tax=Penicillium frequentans TaxID=3151616 RepID=A0AAD6D7Y4_9EURO|nr:hypothetical protein N7494_001416 [Penicillium glabrum]
MAKLTPCTVASVFVYFSVLNSLADLTRQCFAASVSPVTWGVDNPVQSEQKGTGKFARLYGLTNIALPIYDVVNFYDKGICDIPPAGVCLSDGPVFHIIVNTKCGRKRRGEMFPKDFDSDDNILNDRVPRGPTP